MTTGFYIELFWFYMVLYNQFCPKMFYIVLYDKFLQAEKKYLMFSLLGNDLLLSLKNRDKIGVKWHLYYLTTNIAN